MEDQIIAYIKENLVLHQQDAEILPDTDLLGSGLIESLGLVQLIQYIEEEYDIKVEPVDMTIDHFMTVTHITQFIQQLKG